MTFFLTSSRFPGEQRFYSHFSDVTDEVVEARVWAGIHFRHADVEAANLGRGVGLRRHAAVRVRPLKVCIGLAMGGSLHGQAGDYRAITRGDLSVSGG